MSARTPRRASRLCVGAVRYAARSESGEQVVDASVGLLFAGEDAGLNGLAASIHDPQCVRAAKQQHPDYGRNNDQRSVFSGAAASPVAR